MIDDKTRERLAKLLNLLQSPIAAERDGAVAKLNEIASTWNHDWNAVLGTGQRSAFVRRATRPAPIYRPLTPEEAVLIGEMLASLDSLKEQNRWLNSSGVIKMLHQRKARGDITEAQARELHRTGGIKWRFEFHKRHESMMADGFKRMTIGL